MPIAKAGESRTAPERTTDVNGKCADVLDRTTVDRNHVMLSHPSSCPARLYHTVDRKQVGGVAK